jgi:SpoVK/Ycf46/Vps4 family AAA+-type ATPase
VEFFIEDIQPMSWNADAFDHLVYDQQQKDLVLSFVENHNKKPRRAITSNSRRSSSPYVDDVIRGKGQGLIILLSGPPGTGKTLTAEAVADRTRRLLLHLQAEDLGVRADTLGARIKHIFEIATD